MITSVNSASSLLSSLSGSQSKLLKALQELGSGNSINSAADNAVGMAQSLSYSVQLSSDAQAMNNIQYGTSMLDTAATSLGQINQGLQDMRTLAVQAGDGALSNSDLKTIQGQIGQIAQGIDQISKGTQFNGQNLLDGSVGSLSLQIGPNAGDTQSVSLGNFSGSSLGISGLDVTSAGGQANAISALDNAIQQVNSQGASIGALQNGLSSAQSNLSASYENLAAAKSQISDTDFAQVASDLSQAKVQQQASLKALALYNATQKDNLLSLLPK